ncbi:MAG: hypothetical protein JO154_22575 [Chitinophaga sp.]|uniref:hypothetical protein n=1 Tax=Chitinophaga sp. TaxID=1869181 RepID=UPI0025BCDEF8|nr:hypothetical protein [Chitinophaga sp.]MBV8255403.1 hypothetical protein [Chitinophaga sp.]
MKYLRIPFFAALLIVTAMLKVKAQVAIAPQVPPAGIMQQSQLWNILLTNANKTKSYVKVIMRLTDAVTGQGVMTGITRLVELPIGATMLHLADFQPISTEYLLPVQDQRPNAMLLPGKYIICYSVVVDRDKTVAPGTEDCIRFVVEPVSPPILNLPVDKDTLQTSLPAFTWIPPAPLNLYSDLNYDITVVAVWPGQVPADAIQQNIPMYHGAALRQPFLNYPAGAPTLDTGVNYAWMVTALNGRQYSAQTDIHTFRVAKAAPVTEEDLTSFVGLTRNGTTKPLQVGTTLKCSYNNESGEQAVNYEIIALQQQNKVVAQGKLTLQPGPNMISIPLQRVGNLSGGNLYSFRFVNARNESWELKFMYSSPK